MTAQQVPPERLVCSHCGRAQPVDHGARHTQVESRAAAVELVKQVVTLCQADDLDLVRILLADVIDVLTDDLADLFPPVPAREERRRHRTAVSDP